MKDRIVTMFAGRWWNGCRFCAFDLR